MKKLLCLIFFAVAMSGFSQPIIRHVLTTNSPSATTNAVRSITSSNDFTGSFTGNGNGLTNIPFSAIISVMASNITSGGQVPIGAVSTNQLNGGFIVQTGDKHKATLDGSGLTNLNAANLASGTVAEARLPNPLWTNTVTPLYFWTNAVTGGNLVHIPGTGLVYSNALTGTFSLLSGTNGGLNIGGMAAAGAGNIIATNNVTASGSVFGLGLTNFFGNNVAIGPVNVSTSSISGTAGLIIGGNLAVSTIQNVGLGFQNRPSANGNLLSYFDDEAIHFDSNGIVDWTASTTDASAAKVASIDKIASGDLRISTNLFLRGSLTVTNGSVYYQWTVIPTNSIPVSSAGVTNWVLLNMTNTIGGGGPMFIATNYGAAGSFLTMKPTYTVGTYP